MCAVFISCQILLTQPGTDSYSSHGKLLNFVSALREVHIDFKAGRKDFFESFEASKNLKKILCNFQDIDIYWDRY